MATITVLSDLTANKIAAGEVVERPASVVKELIENALDAGADKITVSVNHGGRSLIRVKDNGVGMDRADAEACLLRHATSKIKSVDDIEGIATLGFRGEAIPSIAAVSRFTLTTRTKAVETATRVLVTGGKTDEITETVADTGTLVEVADLFFNTPARKKFLKSDVAEYNAIAGLFSTLALGNHRVSMSLIRNGQTAADYPACDGLLERIGQLFPPEFSEQLIPLDINKPDFSISGYIGSPENNRVNRTGQKFFINKRPIQSAALNNALSRAYDEFLPQRHFPVAILFLAIEPSYVDVNVHPAKREVRIRTEHFFIDIVVKAVKQALSKSGLFAGPEVRPVSMPVPDYPQRPAGSGTLSFSRLKESVSGWDKPSASSFSFESGTNTRPGSELFQKNYVNREIIDHKENIFGVTRVLGQVLSTYILTETQKGLGLFDQHAAHERILYEEILESFDRKTGHSQKMIPETLHLSLQENSVLEQFLDDFEKIGFGINDLGGRTWSVDAVPAFAPEGNTVQAIKDTLHELMAETRPRSREEHRQDLAAILACKSHAIKAGRKLDVSEMEHLIEKLAARKNPHTCPHGRPTFFLLTKDDIEKMFKRK